MAGSGVGLEDKNKSNNDIESLVFRLLREAESPYACPTPIKEFGYVKNGNLSMKEDVIKNQESLASVVYEEKRPGEKTVKAEYKEFQAEIKRIEEAYQGLHEKQGNYINELLRGKKPSLTDCKTAQKDKIAECNTALTALEQKINPPGPPPVALSPAEKALLADIEKQKKALEALPDKIDKDRETLLKKLENQKQRNIQNITDKEITAKTKFEESLFVPYFDKDTVKGQVKKSIDEENKTIFAAGSNQKIPKSYEEAKKFITDEMARAEREPPHVSLFCPFGKEEDELKFLVRRYQDEKTKQWYLEAQMVGDYHIRTPKQFNEMINTLFDFQKFAGCETDAIHLSYENIAYGSNVNQRVDQMLELIEIMKKKTPPKELVLDENAKNAIVSCTSAKKREAIRAGIILLREQAQTYRAEEEKKAQEQILGSGNTAIEKALSSATSNLNSQATRLMDADGKPDDKLTINADTALGKALEHAAGEIREAGSLSLQACVGIAQQAIDDHKDDKEQQGGIVLNTFNEEVNKLEALSLTLGATQKAINEQIKAINTKLEEDPSDPGLEKIKNDLVNLEQNERALYSQLNERCDKWLELKEPVLENYLNEEKEPAAKDKKKEAIDLIRNNAVDDFRDKIESIKHNLDVMQPEIANNQKEVMTCKDEIEKNKENERFKALGRS